MATAKKQNAVVKNYSTEGKELGHVEVEKKLIEYTPNKTLLAQYVRVYLANQRQGTASAKMRSEVAGTTKKVYKQKGTGRARHGSMKAPIYKGGGVVGGPKPKEHRLDLSKSQRQGSLLSAIAQQVQNGNAATVETAITSVKPKTKQIIPLLRAVGSNKDLILVILEDAKADGLLKSLRNVENVQSTHLGSLNAHDILNADKLLFVEHAFEKVQTLFTK